MQFKYGHFCLQKSTWRRLCCQAHVFKAIFLKAMGDMPAGLQITVFHMPTSEKVSLSAA